jgi:glycine/D-amino acid oxidase-like deaminating enzyme
MGAALVGLLPKSDPPITGSFVYESQNWGHRLRDRASSPAPGETISVPVVIVGGGIAGLSAAWRMEKRGFHDFVLLEAEKEAGGNSRWGQNDVSAYPWAAHYLPVPNKKAALVRELCEEFGLLKDGQWDERHLCHSLQERLFLHGRWQENLEPAIGLKAEDRRQFQSFDERMAEYRASGQFAIPMETGKPGRAPELDRLSMQEWMKQERFTSPYLDWYVNYACRDDYGALAADTSAWAGIHYFAAREHEEKGPLTWPEGNGWIVRRLLAKLSRYVRAGAPVHRIEPTAPTTAGRKYRVLAGRTAYLADVVIFTAPTFLAPYIVEGAPRVGVTYSPWLTANLTLERQPEERGAETAWDNVIYDSPALGYVVATHQSLGTRTERTVWTFYWALAQGSPAQNRALLLAKDWNYWKDAILHDLERAHPDIRACVSRLDIFRIGHAMARPVPGFLGSEERKRLAANSGRLLYASSDLSGFSIFEEAQYRGVKAADRAMKLLSRG